MDLPVDRKEVNEYMGNMQKTHLLGFEKIKWPNQEDFDSFQWTFS